MQNEVTKIKEQLENFLSDSNNQIKISERINKGIKKLENEEKNMIKNLSYISKINKTKKDMNKLLSVLMKNIKFCFEENKGEKSNIKYEEYYFNGIPLPENVEFKDISSTSLKICWDINSLNIINVENNKIKYIVEMRKENEKFEKVYEGNNNNCLIENLTKNTIYEFKLYSIYNDLIRELEQIKKIKTIDVYCDSIILNQSNRKDEFLKKNMNGVGIKEWN